MNKVEAQSYLRRRIHDLGGLINSKCEEELEIVLRLAKPNKCICSLHSLFKIKHLACKARLYKTGVMSTILYGCETCTMTKQNRKK